MNSLQVLVATTCVTMAFYILRRPTSRHNRFESLAFVCLYCLCLGLALRFGGRTYPGIYVPNSAFLNGLMNGNGLFVGIGYSAVLLAGAVDTLQILMQPTGQIPAAALNGVKWLGVLLATIIALYGFYWAAILQRVL